MVGRNLRSTPRAVLSRHRSDLDRSTVVIEVSRPQNSVGELVERERQRVTSDQCDLQISLHIAQAVVVQPGDHLHSSVPLHVVDEELVAPPPLVSDFQSRTDDDGIYREFESHLGLLEHRASPRHISDGLSVASAFGFVHGAVVTVIDLSDFHVHESILLVSEYVVLRTQQYRGYTKLVKIIFTL